MSINFCCPALYPSIKTSSVSTDDYEVSNLISTDIQKRQRGFVADYFIKPPVDITVDFICGANISRILIWPQVGSQKSTGFVVFSKIGICQPQGAKSAVQGTAEDSTMYCVGKSFLDSECGLIFTNNQHYLSGEQLASVPPNFLRSPLTHHLSQALTNSCSITLRINKTRSSSVPALAKIEVWGEPSIFASEQMQHKVRELWISATSKLQKHKMQVTTVFPESSSPMKNVHETASELHIPEEFKDPITFEVMIFPMILPSGNVIDQSTLEKHSHEEALWGRTPSDPFTGRMFTDNYRPVFDATLKARIDKFLLENCHRNELKGVGRTLGGKSSHRMNSVHALKSLGVSSSTYKIGNSTCTTKEQHGDFSRKNTLEDTSENEAHRGKMSKKQKTHEEVLDESLDIALKQTLKGLRMFTRVESNDIKVPECTVPKCANCESRKTLYVLPCSHFVCRVCLCEQVESKQVTCKNCHAQYSSSEVKRYHT